MTGASDIEVGGLYRHSKTGNIYTVLHVGIYCGRLGVVDGAFCGFPEGTELVVYTGHYDNPRGNRIYIRPASEWFELVKLPLRGNSSNTVHRFQRWPKDVDAFDMGMCPLRKFP